MFQCYSFCPTLSLPHCVPKFLLYLYCCPANRFISTIFPDSVYKNTMFLFFLLHSVFSSVAQLYPILCDPMDCSMPGFPLHYQLPDIAQTHAHQVSDSIQPSHLLSSPSPPSCNLSQYQGLPHESVFLIQ